MSYFFGVPYNLHCKLCLSILITEHCKGGILVKDKSGSREADGRSEQEGLYMG
jgi:hypothetical protein